MYGKRQKKVEWMHTGQDQFTASSITVGTNGNTGNKMLIFESYLPQS